MIFKRLYIAVVIYIITYGISISAIGGTTCATATVASKGLNTANNSGGQWQWYSYTATSDTFLVLSSIGLTSYDTKVYLYNFICNNPKVLASNDNFIYSYQSKLLFEVKKGESYYIAWYASNGSNNWMLSEETFPSNISCNTARVSNTAIDTIKIKFGTDSWYSYKATNTGYAQLTINNLIEQKIDIYTNCNNAIPIASTNTGSITFPCQKDSNYYIKYSYSNNRIMMRSIYEAFSTETGYDCLNNKTAVEGLNYCNHKDPTNTYLYRQVFSYTLNNDSKITISTKDLSTIPSTVIVSKSCSTLDTIASNISPFTGNDCVFYGRKGETYYFNWRIPQFVNQMFYPWILSVEPIKNFPKGVTCDSPDKLLMGSNVVDFRLLNRKFYHFKAPSNGYLKVKTDKSLGFNLSIHENCDSLLKAGEEFNIFMHQGDSVLLSMDINRKMADPSLKYFTVSFTNSNADQGYSCANPLPVKVGFNYLPSGTSYFVFDAPHNGYVSMYLKDYVKNNTATRIIYNTCSDENTINYVSKQTYAINSNTFDGISVKKGKRYIFKWVSMESNPSFGWNFLFTSSKNDLNFKSFSHSTRIAEPIIDTVNHTIDLVLSKNATLTNVAMIFETFNYAKVYIGSTLQKAGVTQNTFTSPIKYTIVTSDSSTQDWMVNVHLASTLSKENKFLTFAPSSIIQPSEIDTVNHIVKCYFWEDYITPTSSFVSYSTSLYSTLRLNGNVAPPAILNLVSDTVYTITSESGQVQTWKIRIVKRPYPKGKSCTTKIKANIGTINTDKNLEKNYYYFVAPSNGILRFYNNCNLDEMYIGIWNKCDGPFISGKKISNTDTLKYSCFTGDSIFFTLTYNYLNSVLKGLPFYMTFQTTQLSSENSILDYNIGIDRVASTVINRTDKTIHVYPPSYYNFSYIFSTLKISENAKAYLYGTNLLTNLKDIGINYTNPVTIKVVAHNGALANWSIIAHKAKETGNDFTGYGFNEQTGPAIIDTASHFIKVGVKTGTNVTNLIAYFTTSPAAYTVVGSTSQYSFSTANNFTDTIRYNISSATGVSQIWKVLVVIGDTVKNTATDFQSFYFSNQAETAIIDKKNYTIIAKIGINTTLNGLIANFSLSRGAKAKIDTTYQISGITVNNFSDTLTYMIIAEDTTIKKDWMVIVNKVKQTGIFNPIEEAFYFNVFPNPTDGLININLKNTQQKIRLEIYNIFGQLIYINQYQPEQDKIQINLSNQAKGIKFIHIIKDEFSYISKIIIQ